MSRTFYSQMKPAHHPEQLAVLRAGGIPRPVHVQLILSDLCNQDCGFCAYRISTGLSNELFVGKSQVAAVGHNNPKRMIPTEKALEIVEDCAELGVKAIQFTGGGEPTVHPDHLLVFRRAQELGIETALVTNGLRLVPEDEAILGMRWIRVSVDAGDAETYAKVRRVPPQHWEKVWKNIRILAPRYRGVLGIGFVATPENYRSIAAAALLAKEAGVQTLRVGAVFTTEGTAYYGGLIPEIREAIADAKSRADGDGFEIVDLFGRRLGDLDDGNPDYQECWYQYFTVYIGGDLSVYRCCNTAYTTRGKVGSLKEQRFKDAMLAYRPFDARGCLACQFNGQNRAIRALVETPEHVNFV